MKREVKRHFEERFQVAVARRPSLFVLNFHMLDESDRGLLEFPFLLEDLKKLV